MLSRFQLFVTSWTAALEEPLYMGFPRQQYWSGLPFPSLEDLPNPGIEPVSPALVGGFFTTEPPRKPQKRNLKELICLNTYNPNILIDYLSLKKFFCLFIFDCVGARKLSLVVVSGGYFLVAMCVLLLAVASVADHGRWHSGFSGCDTWA